MTQSGFLKLTPEVVLRFKINEDTFTCELTIGDETINLIAENKKDDQKDDEKTPEEKEKISLEDETKESMPESEEE